MSEECEINIFKLVTGEEIIAIVETVEEGYILSDAMGIHSSYGDHGMGMFLAPYLKGSDEDFFLDEDFVMIKSVPTEELLNYYLRKGDSDYLDKRPLN